MYRLTALHLAHFTIGPLVGNKTLVWIELQLILFDA